MSTMPVVVLDEVVEGGILLSQYTVDRSEPGLYMISISTKSKWFKVSCTEGIEDVDGAPTDCFDFVFFPCEGTIRVGDTVKTTTMSFLSGKTTGDDGRWVVHYHGTVSDCFQIVFVWQPSGVKVETFS